MESGKSETKYERLRKIGVGSYGVVFKCANRQTGQIVAIKRYSENDSDPAIRKIAMREVRMLRQLRHPNLIRLIEVFRRKRILHLVFDYCELTVLDVIDRYASNCSLNFIKKIIWQLANGVSHCHSHNCIHRDIKPENILINQAGVVKLCDFGFARNIRGNPSVSGSSSSSSRTAAAAAAAAAQCAKQVQHVRESNLLGVVPAHYHKASGGGGASQASDAEQQQHAQLDSSDNINKENNAAYLASERQALTEYVATRWYRAPELLVGDIYYDAKIDIWAIGCVTAELMRGEPLWPGKTDLDQLSTIMSSLGPLTASQSHTLLTVGLYDHASTERLLSQTRVTDPLERRLPARVGETGADFVLACLRMDPARRPTCDELLEHPFVQSVKMVQFVKGASHTRYAVVSGRDSPARHVTPARPIQAPMSRSNSQAILRAAQQQHQPPANKRLVVAPDSTSPSASSSSTNRTSELLLAIDPSASHLRSSHKRSGSNPSVNSLLPVPVRKQPLVAPARPSAVSTQTIDSSSRRRRRDKRPELAVVEQHSKSSRNRQETTNVHAAMPQTMATPIGTTRRSSSRQHAPVQTNDTKGGRLSQSQSRLPSPTYSLQRQQQQQPPPQTTNTSRSEQQRQHRLSSQMGNTSHLVAPLVEPTKRDRQRTNLDHYGKTRSRGGKQRAGVKQASEPVGVEQQATVAKSMSHNILPPTPPP